MTRQNGVYDDDTEDRGWLVQISVRDMHFASAYLNYLNYYT